MAKQPDKTINAPGPRGQPLDTSSLKQALRDGVPWLEAVTAFAVEMSIPVKQAETVAWRVRREMADEAD